MGNYTCPTPDKQRHGDRKSTARHAKSLQLNKFGSPDLKPYKCHCGYWHVGHSKASLGFRIRQARRKGIA